MAIFPHVSSHHLSSDSPPYNSAFLSSTNPLVTTPPSAQIQWKFNIEFSFHTLHSFQQSSDFNSHLDHPACASYSTVSPTIFFSSTSLQPPSPLVLLLIIAPPPKALFQTHHSNLHLLYSSLLQKFFDLTETANPLSAPLVFWLPSSSKHP